MKITIFAAAALLLAQSMDIRANEDEAGYKQRASRTDLSVFGELDRASKGLLTQEDVMGDMRLGTRFDDIDINRDGVVTLREMHIYIERTYGVIPAPH